jgi:hypothetical protein
MVVQRSVCIDVTLTHLQTKADSQSLDYHDSCAFARSLWAVFRRRYYFHTVTARESKEAFTDHNGLVGSPCHVPHKA